jgi:ubiquinone/menaquinone biosynthesis C-methylase UbiE
MEADEYRKLAEVEDRMWYFHALHGHVERALVKTDRGELRVLDAGCGTGGLIRRLGVRHATWRWTGADLEPLACALARDRTAGTEIRQASVTELPFGEATFDAVVSADVLYHVDDDAAALREFFRVLRPGGIVVINVPAYRWLWSYHDEAVHSRRRYGRKELLAKVHRAGFAGAKATHWNALPFPLVVVRRKLWPAPSGGSDVSLLPAPLEAVFRGAMALERGWLGAFGSLPFGSSIFLVAQKPK